MKKKNLSKLVALAVLLGGVSYGSSAWAGETGFTITIDDYEKTTIAPRGAPLALGKRDQRVGIFSGSCYRYYSIEKIATSERYVRGTNVYGIKYSGEGRYSGLELGTVDEIEVGTRRGTAYAIYLGYDEYGYSCEIGTSDGLGSIKAEAAKQADFFEEDARDAYGIYSTAGTYNIIFTGSASSITANAYDGIVVAGKPFKSNAEGNATGIFVGDSNLTITNLDEINVTAGQNAKGICCDGNRESKINFTGAGAILVKSVGGIDEKGNYVEGTDGNRFAWGIHSLGNSETAPMTINNVGTIKVISRRFAYGYHARGSRDEGSLLAQNTINFREGNSIIVKGDGHSAGLYFESMVNRIGTEGHGLDSIKAGIDDAGNIGDGADGIWIEGGINEVAFSGENSFIEVKSNNSFARGICLGTSTGANVITGLGKIIAESSGNTANGIRLFNGSAEGEDKPLNFSLSMANGSISVYSGSNSSDSRGYTNYGIFSWGTGKTEVVNVKSITAGVSTKDGAIGQRTSGIMIEEGENTIEFTGGSSSSVTAKSYLNSQGVYLGRRGQNTISDIGNITAETVGDNAEQACAIYMMNQNIEPTSIFAVDMDNGNIYAKSSGVKYGIMFGPGSTGTSEVLDVNKIKVEGVSSSSGEGKDLAAAYGIRASGGDNMVLFTGSDSSITVKNSGKAPYAYGIYASDGTNYISDLGSVVVETEGSNNSGGVACGIYAENRNDAGAASDPDTFSVVFDETNGGDIYVDSVDSAYGMFFATGSTGKSSIENVKVISVMGTGNPSGDFHGINIQGGVNDITFKGNDSGIVVLSNSSSAFGIYVNGGTSTITGDATNKTAIYASGAEGEDSASVYVAGGTLTLKNFDLSNSDDSSSYTILAGNAANVSLNLEDSVLGGKIKSKATTAANALTVNLSGTSAWLVAKDDIEGNVNIRLNAGSTFDTSSRDADGETDKAEIKTIDLGSGTFTAIPAVSGETAVYPSISFDAKTEGNDTSGILTTDKIKITGAVSGTIQLGSVNVDDAATTAWTTAKTANLFVDASGNPLNITITGKTVTATENYLYTFTGSENGKVSATSVLAEKFTLPELIQGITERGGQKAGEVNTFSVVEETGYSLAADLGTLNNTLRDSFTINGNGHELKANGKAGVIIGNTAKDILNVKNVTISGFSQFATNNGTLNLNGVTFSGTTGTADVVNNGTLNLKTNPITFDKGIMGTGTTYVKADTNMGSGVLQQGTTKVQTGVTLTVAADKLQSAVINTGTVALGAGTLAAGSTITGGVLNITDDVSTVGGNLVAGTGNNSVVVSADKTLTITNGNLARNITGTTGTTKFTGTSTSTGTIANNLDVAGGTLTINADNIDGTNNTVTGGTLKLNGGQLDNAVTGAGTTEIIADTTLNANLGTTITVDAAKKLTSAANYIGGAVTNNGTVELTGNTLSKTITGGVLNITGDVTSNADNIKSETNTVQSGSTLTFTGEGTLTKTIIGNTKNTGTLTAKLADLGTFENAAGATLNLQGNLTGNIAGTGTTVLQNDVILNADRNVAGTLNGNDKTIDMQVAGTKTVVDKLAGTAKLKIDVDLSATESKSHKLTINGVDATPILDIVSINVVKNSPTVQSGDTGTVTYADGSGVGSVTHKVKGEETGNSIAIVTNNFAYTFTKDATAGVLNYEIATKDVSLKGFIEGTLDGKPSTLSLTDDMDDDDANMTATTQTNTTLNINVNGYSVGTAVGKTVNVGTKTMNIDGGTLQGIVYTSWSTSAGGKLNTSGLLKMEGSVTGAGTLTNTGTLDISANNLGVNTTNTNGAINLGAGTLAAGKKIDGGKITITGDVTAGADDLASTESITINNDKTLTLTGGTIQDEILIESGGNGGLNIAGTVYNDKAKNINVNTLTVTSGSLTTNADCFTLTGGIVNNAETGLVLVGDGELGKYEGITGTGTTVINGGTLTVNAIIAQNIVLTQATDKLVTAADNIGGAVTNNGTVELTGNTLSKTITGGVLNITGDVTANADNIKSETNTVQSGTMLSLTGGTLDKNITNNGTLKIAGDVTISSKLNAGTAGRLLVRSGTLKYTNTDAGSITYDVEIREGATFDPVADVFATAVKNYGTLVLDGGNLSTSVTNFSTGTLKVAAPVTMATGSNITFTKGATLSVEAGQHFAATESEATADKAAILDINSASNITLGDDAKLALTGEVENGVYYVILGGTAVSDLNVWQDLDLKEMFPDDVGVAAYKVVKANGALSIFTIKTTKAEENINCLAGVQQGMISVSNQVADAVTDHLGLVGKGREEDGYKKDVWASYIRNKDDVKGMATSSNQGSFGSDYRAQVNGVTVGADLFTTKKAIGGIAINYATGDTTGTGASIGSAIAQINNKTKYYGVELYNRITNNHHAILMDIGYMHGKNEIGVAEAKSWTADADVNSITAGVRWERDFQLKGSKLVPFAGVRYIRLQNKNFTNSKGLAYSTNSQNIFHPKVGVAWTGEYKMSKSDWTFKPRAEVGYLWALGNKEAETNAGINNYFVTNKFDVTDKNSYYTKLGMDFMRKNFVAGIGYSYMKGDAVRSNRWNVNLSWSF